MFASMLLAMAVLTGSSVITASPAACLPATIHVVRHAEKADGMDRDPPLSEAGVRRAEALAALLRDVPIDAVYASEWRRTQATVAPLAFARALEIRVLPAGEVNRLTERLRTRHCGEHVLVAGHSNTVPALLTRLGIEQAPMLAESDFGGLFTVRFADGAATLQQRRFGD